MVQVGAFESLAVVRPQTFFTCVPQLLSHLFRLTYSQCTHENKQTISKK